MARMFIDGRPVRPCVRCGYCCKKVTCAIGAWIARNRGLVINPCPFLDGSEAPYTCLLVSDHDIVDPAVELGIGAGCCSPLNTDRRVIVEGGYHATVQNW